MKFIPNTPIIYDLLTQVGLWEAKRSNYASSNWVQKSPQVVLWRLLLHTISIAIENFDFPREKKVSSSRRYKKNHVLNPRSICIIVSCKIRINSKWNLPGTKGPRRKITSLLLLLLLLPQSIQQYLLAFCSIVSVFWQQWIWAEILFEMWWFCHSAYGWAEKRSQIQVETRWKLFTFILYALTDTKDPA